VSSDVTPSLLRPRWSKVFSDLWADKTRTGLVIASIAVGVFAIGMIISAYVILREDINRSYAAVNPPNIKIATDPFDKDLVQFIGKLPGVKDAEGRRIIQIRARRGTESWQNLKLVGMSDSPANINLLDPIEGTQFPAKDEVAVSQWVMHITGFKTGDTIQVELPDGSKHDLTVAGLVTDQTTSEIDLNATNSAYVTLKTLKSWGLAGSSNELYVTVDGNGSNPELIASVAARVKQQIKDSDRAVYRMDEKLSTEHPMTSTILAIIGLLGALAVLITILSSSLIINTLNALLTQQLRQIGIMKLVGARSFQILGMYLTLIVAYSLIALALAVPLGAIAGYGLAWFIANLMGAVLQGFRLIPTAVAIQVLIAILIPLGAGYFPVNSGARTSVQQAISNYRPNNQAGKSNFRKLNTKWLGWISRPILLSFRNTFRKWVRLLLTIFTLTVAGAVFIAVFNVRDSVSNVVSQLMQHFMGDVTVNFARPYRVSEIEQSLLRIAGVKGVEGWGGAAGEIWDANDNVVANLSILAPPQNTQLLHPEFVAGRWLLPGEKRAMVVSDTIYSYYPDLKPGDRLVVKLPGQRKEEWKVVGIFRFVGMLGDPLAYATFEYFAGEMHLPNLATSYRVITESHDAASQQELARRIDRYLTDRNFAVQSEQSGYVLQASVTQGVNILVVVLLVMAILTALVGSIGLTGTMSINVLERTREIGVMRTIGAVDMVIMQSVVIEGLVIGLITWVLAIGLSFPISQLLLTIIGESISGSAITLSFTPLGILLWLAVVMVLSVLASIIPAHNAARLTINEVLAYE
jgi:putative ABC transport system permease protein